MKWSGEAPCQCRSSAGVYMTSPARISAMSPLRDWTSPLPSVTYRVWPTACECHAVRAEGVNRTVLTRTREGSSPRGDTVDPDVSGEPLGRPLRAPLLGLDFHSGLLA